MEDDRLAALQGEISRRDAEVARLHEGREARAARLRTLAAVNQLVSSSLDMDHVLREIASAAARLMDVPFVSFWLADEDAQMLTLGAWFGDPTITEAPVRSVKFGEGIVGRVAQDRRSLHVADADERFVARAWARAHGLTSVLAVPVIAEGALLAVLALLARAPVGTDAEDQDLVEIFAAQAAAAIRNAQIFA